MNAGMKARAAIVSLGLVAAGLVASSTPASAAAAPICNTTVVGVRSDGRLVERWVQGTRILENKVSSNGVGVPAESMIWLGDDDVPGGRVYHYQVYYPGRRPALLDVTNLKGSNTLTNKIAGHFIRAVNIKRVADSGRYFVYGIDRYGNLKRFIRYVDDSGNLFLGSPTLVARNMGNLKTLTYHWTYKGGDGAWRDVLYGTTSGGALKQFQIAWRAPGRPKITTLRTRGFASITGLSTTSCGASASYASIVAVDRVNNRARWVTLRYSFTPKSSNLVIRPLVAPGADWRLHAVL